MHLTISSPLFRQMDLTNNNIKIHHAINTNKNLLNIIDDFNREVLTIETDDDVEVPYSSPKVVMMVVNQTQLNVLHRLVYSIN